MNVYDFDGTVYGGDSTLDFYRFVLGRHPAALLCLPSQLAGYVKYKARRIDKTALKESFFRFLAAVPDLECELRLFWDRRETKIRSWYLEAKQPDDVIISASPVFLLEEIRRRLGIGCLIASEVDGRTGKFTGRNCRGAEKAERFREIFGDDAVIDGFYSDSYSDEPMARLARKAYFVDGERIKPWNFRKGIDYDRTE